MASKLKSRSGCLTCVTRKKKCDEKLPSCGHCERLGLACIRRIVQEGNSQRPAVPANSLRTQSPPLQSSISNGYPSFQNDLEKSLVEGSAGALELQVSKLADRGFKNVELLGRFSTQSRLVREAIVAFQASLQESSSDHYKLALSSYQGCIARLRMGRHFGGQNEGETDFALIAICFLGLLEALGLGDPANSVAHFEQCRKLLLMRLSDQSIFRDPDKIKLYRMAAESIIYNLATLSPGDTAWLSTADWGDSFDCLFPDDGVKGRSSSPFLGGFQEFYHIMHQANMLLAKTRQTSKTGEDAELDTGMMFSLWERLGLLEQRIPLLYPVEDEEGEELACTKDPGELASYKALYRAKHTISIHALRIYLIKIARPTATSKDPVVRLYLSKALSILDKQDVLEEWNPALRWPLAILACAASTEEDFKLVASQMEYMENWIDPANRRRLRSAHSTLKDFRRKLGESVPNGPSDFQHLADPLDFLLDPRLLDATPRRSDA